MGVFEEITNFFTDLNPIISIEEPERGVMLRFGKYVKNLEPGMYWQWPIIEEVYKANIRPQTINLPSQSISTLDRIDVVVSGEIVYTIGDIKKALLDVQDYDESLQNFSMGRICRYINNQNYDCCLPLERLERKVQRSIKREEMGLGNI